MTKRKEEPRTLNTTASGWFGAGVKEARVEATDRTVTIRLPGICSFSTSWDEVAQMIVWRESKRKVERELKSLKEG